MLALAGLACEGTAPSSGNAKPGASYVACSSADACAEDTERDFAWIQENILAPDCATSGCHSGTRPKGALDLSTAAASLAGLITADQYFVVPGDPAASRLITSLKGTDPLIPIMPPADSGITLCQGKIDALELWVKGGASDAACTPEPVGGSGGSSGGGGSGVCAVLGQACAADNNQHCLDAGLTCDTIKTNTCQKLGLGKTCADHDCGGLACREESGDGLNVAICYCEDTGGGGAGGDPGTGGTGGDPGTGGTGGDPGTGGTGGDPGTGGTGGDPGTGGTGGSAGGAVCSVIGQACSAENNQHCLDAGLTCDTVKTNTCQKLGLGKTCADHDCGGLACREESGDGLNVAICYCEGGAGGSGGSAGGSGGSTGGTGGSAGGSGGSTGGTGGSTGGSGGTPGTGGSTGGSGGTPGTGGSGAGGAGGRPGSGGWTWGPWRWRPWQWSGWGRNR